MEISIKEFLTSNFSLDCSKYEIENLNLFSILTQAYKDSKKFNSLDFGGNDRLLQLIDTIGYNNLVNDGSFRTAMIKISLSNGDSSVKKFLMKKYVNHFNQQEKTCFLLIPLKNPTEQYLIFESLSQKQSSITKLFDMDFLLTQKELKEEFKYFSKDKINKIDSNNSNFTFLGNLFSKEYDNQIYYIAFFVRNKSFLNCSFKYQSCFGLKYMKKTLPKTLEVDFWLDNGNVKFNVLNSEKNQNLLNIDLINLFVKKFKTDIEKMLLNC